MSNSGDAPGSNRITLISPKDMALTLTVPIGSLYNLVNEGRLPHLHVGRKLCFKKLEVLDWLERGGDEVFGKVACPVCLKRREERRLETERKG